ncbi:MAG: tRNA (guanosine(46)-N7)-methyltransferase TrmB [Campylobacterales bacterium]
MPHFVTNSLNLPDLPYRHNKSEFLFQSIEDDSFVIGVNVEGIEFLLRAKEEQGKLLVKHDKRVRVPSIGVVKQALLDLLDLSAQDLLYSNIASISSKQKTIKNHIEAQEVFSLLQKHQKCSLEIGFGSGRHLLKNALENRDMLYIGVEIHTPSIMQVLRQIELQKLDNLYILSLDARVLLEVLPSNSLDEVFIHFPIPWDSSPAKRIITKESAENISRALKKDGFLHLRSDSDSFYEYSLDVIKNTRGLVIDSFINKDIEVVSKYEQRWRKHQKIIRDIYAYSEGNSPQNQTRELPNLESIDIKKVAENKKAWREGSVFVAIKEMLELKNGGSLLFFTGGSIYSPVKHFLVDLGRGVSFFGPKPLASDANIKMLEVLREWGNG